MSIPPSDASIPVLTQVIGAPKADAVSERPVVAVNQTATPGQTQERGGVQRPDEDWKALELKLNERVLRQILRRVDFVIEHRVKETLAQVLQSATEDLIKEIRSGLHVTLEDVIKRAVAQEIARVQAIKN